MDAVSKRILETKLVRAFVEFVKTIDFSNTIKPRPTQPGEYYISCLQSLAL